jgi:triacylglycerol lipase
MPPTVKLDQGTYVGKVIENVDHPVSMEAFLGVRYAHPPVRNLRFAKPVALPPSKEVFHASEYGCR